jgi:hypothetical protein
VSRFLVVTVAAFAILGGTALAQTPNPLLGTWKMNVAKSNGGRSRSSARSSALALFAQLPECLLGIDRFHPAALEIVVAGVERLADRSNLFQVPSEGVFDDVSGRTSAGLGEILQFVGRFGRDVHSHAATVRLPAELSGMQDMEFEGDGVRHEM